MIIVRRNQWKVTLKPQKQFSEVIRKLLWEVKLSMVTHLLTKHVIEHRVGGKEIAFVGTCVCVCVRDAKCLEPHPWEMNVHLNVRCL